MLRRERKWNTATTGLWASFEIGLHEFPSLGICILIIRPTPRRKPYKNLRESWLQEEGISRVWYVWAKERGANVSGFHGTETGVERVTVSKDRLRIVNHSEGITGSSLGRGRMGLKIYFQHHWGDGLWTMQRDHGMLMHKQPRGCLRLG